MAEEQDNLKLSFQKANDEVKSWLDFKKVSDVKRLMMNDNIKRLIYAFADGRLVMDADTKVITQTLKFPIGKDASVKELKFRPRIPIIEAQTRLAEVKEEDGIGRVLAYVGAATGEMSSVVGLMDAEDYHLSADLVVFFMMLN